MLKRAVLAGIAAAVMGAPALAKTSIATEDRSLTAANTTASSHDCVDGFDARIGGTLQIDSPVQPDQAGKEPDRAESQANCTVV